MSQTIDLTKKKKSFIGKREIIISVLAVVLATAGIKASDSLLGGEKESSLCPSDMAYIPSSGGGFCIDKYEASAGNGCPNKDTGSQRDSRLNMTNADCKPASAEGAIPWVYISQTQAREACARAGKRLPSNKEWLSASLGTPDKNSLWLTSDCQVAENWKNQPGLTGSGETCVSSFGAFDMIGNVWEWTDETISDGKLNGEILPSQGFVYEANADGIAIEISDSPSDNYKNDYFWIKNTGVRGVARGGFYSNEEEAGVYSAYLVSQPSYIGIGVGFRCVK
ncbi:MAG: SUMF1/EgtB/PvdO family nonheme iron enzyme [Patescibacteria group bacterium]|jgi:formylglycine-generating enzyme required for sulfatase activity|nr:SUMF1/EgtB/PvdO family nonheme iron enzyme [Patescibacteria group bacterium]